ncbi:MAG: site-specific DNA-methyltransferase, partial [Candidatus Omnitrophica bacterium]|nr:site-specific DNA-methyltransferase [Candidatus Omnitrophota bacterium]
AGQPATDSLFCVKCGTPRYLLGHEEHVDAYIQNLCGIFDEAFRLLKEDGVCCVTLGDTRAGSGSLFGIPFRFAEEMRKRKRKWVLKDVFMLQRRANSDMDHVFVFTKTDVPMGKWKHSPLKVFHGQTVVKGFGYGAFPANMVSRLLEIYCPKDGVVMDFFCGSGIVLRLAKDFGCSYVGIEINKEYAEIGRELLQ